VNYETKQKAVLFHETPCTYLAVLALKPQIYLLCLGLVKTTGFGLGLRDCWPWMHHRCSRIQYPTIQGHSRSL